MKINIVERTHSLPAQTVQMVTTVTRTLQRSSPTGSDLSLVALLIKTRHISVKRVSIVTIPSPMVKLRLSMTALKVPTCPDSVLRL